MPLIPPPPRILFYAGYDDKAYSIENNQGERSFNPIPLGSPQASTWLRLVDINPRQGMMMYSMYSELIRRFFIFRVARRDGMGSSTVFDFWFLQGICTMVRPNQMPRRNAKVNKCSKIENRILPSLRNPDRATMVLGNQASMANIDQSSFTKGPRIHLSSARSMEYEDSRWYCHLVGSVAVSGFELYSHGGSGRMYDYTRYQK